MPLHQIWNQKGELIYEKETPEPACPYITVVAEYENATGLPEKVEILKRELANHIRQRT